MLKLLAPVLAAALAVPAAGQVGPLVIAHRGASGERPEHTLAAYERAIDQGADYIELDLVPTKDGVLVSRHENELSGTTDVSQHPEFASRRTTRRIDGEDVTGWFTEDFTLAELSSLRAIERLPELRPANTAFDGLFPVPTLGEVLALVKAKEAETGRRIGLYPEIKHPSYFAEIGHDPATTLVGQLSAAGYDSADAPVFIQSFEPTVLRRLDAETALPLVLLIAADGAPADLPETSYRSMLTVEGLREIATFADGIGPDMRLVLKPDGTSTGLVEAAHAAGLKVHPWTLRKESAFLPDQLRGATPAEPGCYDILYDRLVSVEVDGIFTDNPGPVTAWRNGGVRSCAGLWAPDLPPGHTGRLGGAPLDSRQARFLAVTM